MSNVDKETGIWSLNIAKKRHKCDLILAATIGVNYYPDSTADIGCGNGQYCGIFKSYGWKKVVGYEGTDDVHKLGYYKDIIRIDLTKKLHKLPKYDLVLCLEVGEHIPPQHEQIFIDNLCAFCDNDLILSWASPGQYSASGHVNCKSRSYIIEQFEKRGFKYNHKKSQVLMLNAQFSWFKKNLMVFKKI